MRWAEIAIETDAAGQEAIAEVIAESGCGGVAISGGTPAIVRCYLPVDDRLEGRLSAMQAGFERLREHGAVAGRPELTVRYVEEQDWADAWKQYFRTTRVGDRLVIRPPWEEYQAERRDIVIEIEPGMAFGTGTHATTRMCLEALEKYLKPRMKVVDFGTGSGILAIAAAKLGASIVIALDADEVAVRAARENVVRNDQEERIEVHNTDRLDFIGTGIDLVAANIVAETIIRAAEPLACMLRTGGVLIASGIVEEKSPDVERALRNAGFDIREVLSEGEWVTLVAHRSR